MAEDTKEQSRFARVADLQRLELDAQQALSKQDQQAYDAALKRAEELGISTAVADIGFKAAYWAVRTGRGNNNTK